MENYTEYSTYIEGPSVNLMGGTSIHFIGHSISRLEEMAQTTYPDLQQGLSQIGDECRSYIEDCILRLCKLHATPKTIIPGVNVNFGYQQCQILEVYCSNLRSHAEGTIHYDTLAGVLEALKACLKDHKRRRRKTTISSKYIVQLVSVIHALPIFELLFNFTVRIELADGVSRYETALNQRFDLIHKDGVDCYQQQLKKTLERLHARGEGGRFSRFSTILIATVVSRKGDNIKWQAVWYTFACKAELDFAIPTILAKLKETDRDSTFDPAEICLLLALYAFMPTPLEHREEHISTDSVPDLVTDLIGLTLYSNYWMEKYLDLLELMWEMDGQPTWEIQRRRGLAIDAIETTDRMPKPLMWLAFDHENMADMETGSMEREQLPPMESRGTANSQPCNGLAQAEELLRVLAALKTKGVAIDFLLQQIASMNQKQEQTDQKATPKPKKVPIIQHKVQKQTVSAMANTTNSQSEEMIALKKAVSTQKERQIESDFAFQDMKETLKRTREGLAAAREDNTRLKARQEKEGDAIFNSLNAKIVERDAQLEAANIRKTELEREMKRKESNAAKDAKKERDRAAAAEEAHDLIVAELDTVKADLEAVEASKAALSDKLETFREKQREFVQKAGKVKTELDECKAALSKSRGAEGMTDALVAKAIRDTEASKEKELEKRTADMTEKIKEMMVTKDALEQKLADARVDLEQELIKKDERILKLEEYVKKLKAAIMTETL